MPGAARLAGGRAVVVRVGVAAVAVAVAAVDAFALVGRSRRLRPQRQSGDCIVVGGREAPPDSRLRAGE